jgi:hypothetical protein
MINDGHIRWKEIGGSDTISALKGPTQEKDDQLATNGKCSRFVVGS